MPARIHKMEHMAADGLHTVGDSTADDEAEWRKFRERLQSQAEDPSILEQYPQAIMTMGRLGGRVSEAELNETAQLTVLAKLLLRHGRPPHRALLEGIVGARDRLPDPPQADDSLRALSAICGSDMLALRVALARRLNLNEEPMDWAVMLKLKGGEDQAWWLSRPQHQLQEACLGIMPFMHLPLETTLRLLERATLQPGHELARVLLAAQVRRHRLEAADLLPSVKCLTRRLLLVSLLPFASLLPGKRVAFEQALKVGRQALPLTRGLLAARDTWPAASWRCLLDLFLRCLANLVRESVLEHSLLGEVSKLLGECHCSLAGDQLRVALLQRGVSGDGIVWHSRLLQAITLNLDKQPPDNWAVKHGCLVGMEAVARFASDLTRIQQPPYAALQPLLLQHMRGEIADDHHVTSDAASLLSKPFNWPPPLGPLVSSPLQMQAQLRSEVERLADGIKRYRRNIPDDENDPFLFSLIEQLTMNIRE